MGQTDLFADIQTNRLLKFVVIPNSKDLSLIIVSADIAETGPIDCFTNPKRIEDVCTIDKPLTVDFTAGSF